MLLRPPPQQGVDKLEVGDTDEGVEGGTHESFRSDSPTCKSGDGKESWTLSGACWSQARGRSVLAESVLRARVSVELCPPLARDGEDRRSSKGTEVWGMGQAPFGDAGGGHHQEEPWRAGCLTVLYQPRDLGHPEHLTPSLWPRAHFHAEVCRTVESFGKARKPGL